MKISDFQKLTREQKIEYAKNEIREWKKFIKLIKSK